MRKIKSLLLLPIFLLLFSSVIWADEPKGSSNLVAPDGKPADMQKKVKVFIIMGQSNTLEMGKVKGDQEGSLEHAVKKITI